MTLPASGQIDFGSIYTEYYKTVAPSVQMDMKQLSQLYNGPSIIDASISYFHGFEAIQGQLWRFQDPWTGSDFNFTSDSCTVVDNNMIANTKYDYTFLIEPSFGGYNGGTIDVSIRVDCSLIYSGPGTAYVQNVFFRCSSNGSTYNEIVSNSFSGSSNRSINISGTFNLPNVTLGTGGQNLKLQIQQDMTPPGGNFDTYISNLNFVIYNVHNDQALKTTRLFSNSFGRSSGIAIENRFVSGVYDFLNWDLEIY